MTTDPSVSRRGFLRATAGAGGIAGATGVAGAQEGATVTVELVDFAFEPGTDEPLEIPPGTTVQFVWETDSHNIVVESQPDEADWEGHETIENSGFETEHTFDVVGDYEFFCQPHRGQGMIGTIIVDEDAEPPSGGNGGGNGGPTGPTLPESAKTIGVATFGLFVVTLAAAFALMKYGGEFEPD